jgi:hypothetical protein
MLIGFGSAVAVLLGFGTYRTVRRNRKLHQQQLREDSHSAAGMKI